MTTDDPRHYMRLAGELRDQIKDGRLSPVTPYLPYTTLKQGSGYSRRTVGHAMEVLGREGLLKRYPGLGYYVT
jgi:DNA-binding GntR family transcriptional regulator